MPYDEVAAAVGKTPAAVRQVARRARAHVAARRPRVEVSRSEHRTVVDRFIAACTPGASRTSWRSWRRMWSSSPTAVGSRPPLRPPPHGAELVAKMLAGTDRAAFETTAVWLNGAPAIRIASDSGGAAVSLVVENGRVTRIYATSNPQKLSRLDKPTDLTR